MKSKIEPMHKDNCPYAKWILLGGIAVIIVTGVRYFL